MGQNRIQVLLETIKDHPDSPFTYFALAQEYQKLDDIASAKKYYRHLVHHFPEYGGTYYHYANLLIDDNEHEEALKIIESGLPVLQQSGEHHLFSELVSLRDHFLDH